MNILIDLTLRCLNTVSQRPYFSIALKMDFSLSDRCKIFTSNWLWIEICEKALKVQILNEVALIQVVRKRVSFQDRKNENTPKFPSIKI